MPSLCARKEETARDEERRGNKERREGWAKGVATDPANVAISSFLFSFLSPCHFFFSPFRPPPPPLPGSPRLNDHGRSMPAALLFSSPRGARERASGWMVCTRKNFWSSSNKSFRSPPPSPSVFSATAVNKRSARLWRFRADYRKLAELC